MAALETPIATVQVPVYSINPIENNNTATSKNVKTASTLLITILHPYRIYSSLNKQNKHSNTKCKFNKAKHYNYKRITKETTY